MTSKYPLNLVKLEMQYQDLNPLIELILLLVYDTHQYVGSGKVQEYPRIVVKELKD